MTDPIPCNTCSKSERCQADKLGCVALVLHVRGASLDRIRFAPRQPSAALLVEALVVPAETRTAADAKSVKKKRKLTELAAAGLFTR